MNSGATLEMNAGELINRLEGEFTAARLFYGHGTANARDEAAALVFHVLQLDHAEAPGNYGYVANAAQLETIQELRKRRINERIPLPYLLHEAWFAGLPFYVDERVLIPRSPIAELIAQMFEPWVDGSSVNSILEVGTGSGCIAIACAHMFPAAQVVATDISDAALAVARLNVERHALEGRVQLIETDHTDGVAGPFDLIISNPPYVPQAEQAELAEEYRHEPALGLFSGADGLDSARRILQDAPGLLTVGGLLVLEVGAQSQDLETAFPELAFTWPEFEHGGTGVAILRGSELG
jgi:ribosomal protein L3 glutamine methyltransferase